MSMDHVSIVPRDEKHLQELHAKLIALGANDFHANDEDGFLGTYKLRNAEAIGVDNENDIVGYLAEHPERDRSTEEQFFLDVIAKLR